MCGSGTRVLRRDARHAAGRDRLLVLHPGDNEAAKADAEIDRLVHVDLTLDENIATTHPEIGGAVFDVRGDIVGFEEKELERMSGEDRPTDKGTALARERLGQWPRRRAGVAIRLGGGHTCASEELGYRPERAPLRQRDRQWYCARHASAPRTRSTSPPRPRSLSSMHS